MTTHVIKHDHDNGKKLKKPILWCGKEGSNLEFYFVDTHHAALSVGGSIQPCKNCLKAIIKELEKELC